MSIESIIFELMERIQVLEKKVARLESEKAGSGFAENEIRNTDSAEIVSNEMIVKTKNEAISLTQRQRARDYIDQEKFAARERGEKSVTLLCNDIQKALKIKNRPRNICEAMYDCMTNPKDRVLHAPPSGFSTTVLIEYCLE